MRRVALGVALGVALTGCTPPADAVGAWTTGDATSGLESSSSDGVPAEESSTGADTSSSSSSSSGSSSGDPNSESTTQAVADPPPWVASVAAGAPPRLRAIDLDGGEVVSLCDLVGVGEPDGLAFLPDGRLVGTEAATSTQWVADPCDCSITIVPPLELELALHAMAERDDPVPTIVGVDAARVGLFEVRVDEPAVQLLGEFLAASTITALAAAPDTDDLHALADVGGPRLQRIDPAGVITSDIAIALPDDATGLTISPTDDTLIACDGDGMLWRIDPTDGTTDPLAVAWPDACRTLATPHSTIACIDDAFGA
jgi:hypothetical protein